MSATYSLESLPFGLQQQIVGFVSRASVKTSLLSKEDIQILTGYSKRSVETMIQDPLFPACVRPIDGGQKRWRCGAVMAFLDRKQKDW